MTKIIEFEGVKHEFPDDFTNDEIRGALTTYKPQQAQPQQQVAPLEASNTTGIDKGPVANALKPITNYPGTFAKMRHESQDQMARGANQIMHPEGAMDVVKGVGNAALGFVGNALAPANAAIDTIVGQPIEENTGVPRELTDFAATMALPMPKSVPRVGGGTAKAAEKVAAPTVDQLYASAKSGFEHPEVKALSLKPKAATDWSNGLRAKLTDAGLDENVAPKSWAILRGLDKSTEGATLTGNNLQSLRRTFGRAAGTMDPSEKAAAARAIESLDSFIESGVPKGMVLRGDPSLVASIWSNARGDYAAAKRSERITEAMEKAGNNAGASHSGQNIDNSMRQQIKAILNSPKARRGYSGEELRQMQRVIRGTYPGDAARFIGNLLGGGGGLGMTATASMGTAMAGGVTHGLPGLAIGAIAPIAGFGIKKLGNAITSGEVEKLQTLIQSRSPLAKQMQGPLESWGKSVAAFNGSKTPGNIAKLMIASRNLANNLADAGIVTSAEKLIGSLQGPSQSSAEDKQP